MKELRLFKTWTVVILLVLLLSVFIINAYAETAKKETIAAKAPNKETIATKAPKKETITADSYICTAEKSTGFAYNETITDWEITSFNTSVNKYFIVKSEKNDFIKAIWEVRRIGKNYPTFYCPTDFDKYGYLNCELMGTFTMNNNNLRYLLVFPFGYVSDNIKDEDGTIIIKEGESSPFLEIGKCTPS